MASSSPTPLTEQAKQAKIQEFESRFIEQLKALQFKEALRTAESVLALDPNNGRVKEFVPVLQEKIELGEEDSSDEEGDDVGVQQDGASEDGDSSDEGESDDDDDSDDESEDGSTGAGNASADEATDKIPAYPPSAAQPLLNHQDGASLSAVVPPPPAAATQPALTAQQRKSMREGLAKSIAELKEKELAAQIADADPLLGA